MHDARDLGVVYIGQHQNRQLLCWKACELGAKTVLGDTMPDLAMVAYLRILLAERIAVARLFDLIRITSVSTDQAHATDCCRAADWLSKELSTLGLDTSVRPTARHPMALGHDRSGERPHVQFYGHYDAQTLDPLVLWRSDLLEPKWVPQPDGATHIVARGVSDNKGELLTFVEACYT